jgi:hypothetical protein
MGSDHFFPSILNLQKVLVILVFKGIIIVTVQYCTTMLPSTNVSSTEVLTSCSSLILCIYYRLSYLRICLHMGMLTRVISDYLTHIFKKIGINK